MNFPTQSNAITHSTIVSEQCIEDADTPGQFDASLNNSDMTTTHGESTSSSHYEVRYVLK